MFSSPSMTMPEAPVGKPLGLFGGTFDPLHYGHLRLAEEAADALDLARVRWIPAGQPALRAAPQASAAQRLEMVRLAIADNPRFEVDAAEVESARPSYTVATLERLRQAGACGAQRPLVLLLGADAFSGLAEWHRWEALFDLAHIAVAYRPGFPLAPANLPDALARCYRDRFCEYPATLSAAPAGRIAAFAMTPLDISATKIRALLSKHCSPRYLLPDALLAYINDHHLYPET
jgi:nicotinate-nucleotide adenylyltransferase